ncbi:MAG: hypothetical protein ACK2UU_24140, partial [Anaerolineae bacterium]
GDRQPWIPAARRNSSHAPGMRAPAQPGRRRPGSQTATRGASETNGGLRQQEPERAIHGLVIIVANIE